jgi:hypothetical protein
VRYLIRCLPFTVLATSLAACTTGGNPVPSASKPPTSAVVKASSSPAAPATGPLGVLAVPADATPFSQNTNSPMGLDAFVQGYYAKSAWKEEESLLTRRGFESGAIEGWQNPDGSQQNIVIARFATSNGALSQFESTISVWRAQPAPSRVIIDAKVGGLGWVNPTLDSHGDARVEIAVRDGDMVISVVDYAAAFPDIAAAEALMLKQYDSLKTAA